MITAMEPLYSGKAMLPRAAPFMESLRHEMVQFPNGKHDDRCDSLSQALNYIVRKRALLDRVSGERPPGRSRSGSRGSRRVDNDDFML